MIIRFNDLENLVQQALILGKEQSGCIRNWLPMTDLTRRCFNKSCLASTYTPVWSLECQAICSEAGDISSPKQLTGTLSVKYCESPNSRTERYLTHELLISYSLYGRYQGEF